MSQSKNIFYSMFLDDFVFCWIESPTMNNSPPSDILDDLLFNKDENMYSDSGDDDDKDDDNDNGDKKSNEFSLPTTNISSRNELKIKKRRFETPSDSQECKKKKKSKSQPSYMRRNIRTLLTKDKLQGDTLSALKAEQDRLKRLEEINHSYQTICTHLPTNNNHTSTLLKPNEAECIVLDDDDNEGNDNHCYHNHENITSASKSKNDAGQAFIFNYFEYFKVYFRRKNFNQRPHR